MGNDKTFWALFNTPSLSLDHSPTILKRQFRSYLANSRNYMLLCGVRVTTFCGPIAVFSTVNRLRFWPERSVAVKRRKKKEIKPKISGKKTAMTLNLSRGAACSIWSFSSLKISRFIFLSEFMEWVISIYIIYTWTIILIFLLLLL